MGGVNINKEKEEFEKELDERDKKEFQEKLNEKEKSAKKDNELKKMYIYLYSHTKIPEDFKTEICNSQSLKSIKLNGIDAIELVNKERDNWVFYLINEGNEEKLKSISLNFKNKDSVFICFSKSLSSPEIDKILTIFSKVFLKYQPFYLFLTEEEEPDINIILKKVSSYTKMDIRNFFSMKYDKSNKDMHINIFKHITKFFSYYNELGDFITFEDEEKSFASRLNILVCGRAGVGKSTFINKILNEKRCREGSGQSVTKKISFYNHSEYPLAIYDTPGFENDETVKNVIEAIKKQNKDFKAMKQSIHLILYLVRYGERTFLEFEKSVLSQLADFNAKILFVVTKSPYKLKDEQFEEFQDTLCNDIMEMFKDVDKNIVNKLFGENFSDLMMSIFPINSKKERKDDEEFGLDILFEKCYDNFKNEIIPFQILFELENGEEKHIEEILGKYMLFKVYKSRKDIISSAKKQAMKKIMKFTFYASIASYLPSFGNAINLERLLCAMATSLSKVYARNLTKEEAKAFVSYDLQKKEERLKETKSNSIFKTIYSFIYIPLSFICWPIGLATFLICSNISMITIYKVGKRISQKMAEELEQNIPLYLFQLSISFNLGIKSLSDMKDKYSKLYINEKESK